MTAPTVTEGPRTSGFTAGCLLVSNVIGGGIFTTTGFMARDLGDPFVILLLWAGGALFALTGALSYAELGAALPRVGGEYVYLTEAYGPLLGYLSGWASFTVGFGAAVAASSMSFAAYALQLSPLTPSGPVGTGLALLLVWSLTLVHLRGTAAGGTLQRLLTITKAAAILLLIAGGLVLGRGSWEHLQPVERPPVAPGALAVGFIFVLYAYSGWNAVGYIAGEVGEPQRTIPRALIWGTLFVGLVYVLLNAVYFYALPVTALAHPPVLPVAEKAAVALFGPHAASVVTALLCLSIAAAVSAMIWAGPRVYFALAQDGRIPALLARTAGPQRTPRHAILLQSLWATVLIVTGTFEQLVVYTGVVLAAFSALGVSAVIVLRARQPALRRPFRVPLYPLPPCAYILVSAGILGYTLVERPHEALLGLVTVLAGIPFYLFMTRGRAAPS